MKVSITGHTRGIGKALTETFSTHGYDTIGFSTSNGYDIADKTSRKQILKLSEDADIFINNAYHPEGQTLLLLDMINLWDNTNKLIINIGSKCTLAYINGVENEYILEYLKQYTNAKQAQDTIIKSRMGISTPRLLNVVPGVVDTDMTSTMICNKMDASKVSSLILHLVSICHWINVQEIVIDAPGANWGDIKFT